MGVLSEIGMGGLSFSAWLLHGTLIILKNFRNVPSDSQMSVIQMLGRLLKSEYITSILIKDRLIEFN